MNATRIRVAGALLAAVAAWALWQGADRPNDTTVPADGVAAAPGPPQPTAPQTRADAARAPATRRPVPPQPDAQSGDATASPDARDPQRERVLDELAAEVATLALERLGDAYIDYLVANGLPRADSEDIVTTGFHAASRCSLEAMREQAEAESVPLDTVLYALHAELYDTDGPLLTSTIDLEAVAAREAPCALNALQEAGIPPSVAAEIQRSALSR